MIYEVVLANIAQIPLLPKKYNYSHSGGLLSRYRAFISDKEWHGLKFWTTMLMILFPKYLSKMNILIFYRYDNKKDYRYRRHYGYFCLAGSVIERRHNTRIANDWAMYRLPSSYELIRDKRLIGIKQMIDGLIDDPKLGYSSFYDRPFMASSSFKIQQKMMRKVQIIEDDIINKMQPPMI